MRVVESVREESVEKSERSVSIEFSALAIFCSRDVRVDEKKYCCSVSVFSRNELAGAIGEIETFLPPVSVSGNGADCGDGVREIFFSSASRGGGVATIFCSLVCSD